MKLKRGMSENTEEKKRWYHYSKIFLVFIMISFEKRIQKNILFCLYSLCALSQFLVPYVHNNSYLVSTSILIQMLADSFIPTVW